MHVQLKVKKLKRDIKNDSRNIVQIKETKKFWVKQYKKISKEQSQFTKLYKSCDDSPEGKSLSATLKNTFVILTTGIVFF